MTWTRCEWLTSIVPGCLCNRHNFRTESGTETDEKLLWSADAAVVRTARSTITNVLGQGHKSAVSVTLVGCDALERLVKLRFLHQTQRASKSVRSRGEPKTKPQGVQLVVPSAAAERQKLCVQMADVIRRSETGLERCTRWRSAPGTMDRSEISELNGNSANAEVAAKDRVKAVSVFFLITGPLSLQ